MMMKTLASKAQVIKINLVFLAFFLVIYIALLLQPPFLFYDGPGVSSSVWCSLRDCSHMKKGGGSDQYGDGVITLSPVQEKRRTVKETIPSFPGELRWNARIGLVNLGEDEVTGGGGGGVGRRALEVRFDRVSELFEWKHLFPEWIDEEEENEGPSCPEIPMPDLSGYGEVDAVAARLPCRYPEEGWARDVFRLQVHLVVANLAARRGRRDGRGRVKLALLSSCRPMIEIFRSEELVRKEGGWWVYESSAGRLEEKLAMPLGSCKLALPLWVEGTNEEFDYSKKFQSPQDTTRRREAYVTVLHSSDAYVCGAIALAQGILRTGSQRDLVLLHDKSISEPKRRALAAAGWQLRKIRRIRNPRAERNSYNEYNYSKLRLWQLTDYAKLVFVDADVAVLRNIDLLFHFPEMSATGNDGVIFNSGVMVIEPSNATFAILMEKRREIVSYNGGDQGFLNEVFVWWHRLPRRVNFLKNFWSNTSAEAHLKNRLFGADPPELYAIHYLGLKPWLCYRDYDCNWNIADQRVYASDVAHRTWWRLHDAMDPSLQRFCGLSEQRKTDLDWDRHMAELAGFPDAHWKLNISDRRRHEQRHHQIS